MRSAGLLGTLGASLTINFANFASGIIAARFLLAEGRGELAVAQLFGSIIASLTLLGLDQSLIFHGKLAPAECRGSIYRKLLAMALLSSLAISFVLIFFSLQFESSAVGLSPDLVFYVILFIPINNVGVLAVTRLLAAGRTAGWNIARALVHLLTALLMAITFWWGYRSPSAAAAAIIWANIGTLLVACWLGLRDNAPAAPTDPAQSRRRLLSYGLRAHASSVLRLLSERVDQLFVLIYFSATSLGLYVVSLVALRGLQGALAPLEQLLFRSLVGRREGAATTGLIALSGLNLIVSLLASATLWLTAPMLIDFLFGAAFTASGRFLQILCWALAPSVGRLLLGSYLKAAGRPGAASMLDLVNFILLCALLIVGADHGLEGISAAVVASAWATYLIAFGYVLRASSIGFVPATRGDLAYVREAFRCSVAHARGRAR